MMTRPSAIIVTDGGVDLPEGFAEYYGIHIVPLMLQFGDESLRSGVDISAAAFYQRLREDPHHPTTSQPAAGDYLKVYQDAAEAGLPVLSFHLSAGLSGSINSARMARELLPYVDIRIVDTGTLSGAMALQVMVAAAMAREGAEPDAILTEAKRIGEASGLYYTIDTLEYLRRGGRIGKVAGYVGSLLGIRPIITVEKESGTYTAVGRARSFRKGIDTIVDRVVSDVGEGEELTAIILHGDCLPEAQRLLEGLSRRTRVVTAEVVRANPSLGVHVGPMAVGVAYYPGRLPVELTGFAEVTTAD